MLDRYYRASFVITSLIEVSGEFVTKIEAERRILQLINPISSCPHPFGLMTRGTIHKTGSTLGSSLSNRVKQQVLPSCRVCTPFHH